MNNRKEERNDETRRTRNSLLSSFLLYHSMSVVLNFKFRFYFSRNFIVEICFHLFELNNILKVSAQESLKLFQIAFFGLNSTFKVQNLSFLVLTLLTSFPFPINAYFLKTAFKCCYLSLSALLLFSQISREMLLFYYFWEQQKCFLFFLMPFSNS